MNQKFKPPSIDNIKEWEVVEYLFHKGFDYYSHIVDGKIDWEGKLKQEWVDYPKTMKEAVEFFPDL